MTSGLSPSRYALLFLLLATSSATVADAPSQDATLADIHYTPPAGWKSLEPPAGQSLSRMYATPDVPQGQQADVGG
jgi:hypothetical protein